jgi:hypothetical protein
MEETCRWWAKQRRRGIQQCWPAHDGVVQIRGCPGGRHACLIAPSALWRLRIKLHFSAIKQLFKTRKIHRTAGVLDIRCRSVSVVTTLADSSQGPIFFSEQRPDRLMAPHTASDEYFGLPRGQNWAASSAEVKNAWSCTFVFLWCFMHRKNYRLPVCGVLRLRGGLTRCSVQTTWSPPVLRFLAFHLPAWS